MLAIKTAPTILYKNVNSIIGSPDDYKNNKNANKFPDSYDIRIPTAIRPEILEIPKEDEEIKASALTTKLQKRKKIKYKKSP